MDVNNPLKMVLYNRYWSIPMDVIRNPFTNSMIFQDGHHQPGFVRRIRFNWCWNPNFRMVNLILFMFHPSLLLVQRSFQSKSFDVKSEVFCMVNLNPIFTCLIPVFWWSNSKNTYIRWANPNFWRDILNWFVGALVHEEMLKLKKKLREIQKIEDRNCLRSVVRHVFFPQEVMLRCSSARTVFVALEWFAWCTRILFEAQTHVVNQ